ncbi:uncharacterized protein LOC110347176 isoform X1 [Heterocephalus glaber]|uniref:Uncharacterized protein LOC110347176 isoform X1 n=1 Tax=Heterocephalus glaber TaxID=10181 RepID=A0AAX6SBR9_HETGA|nr:uncharacterized protein LOC110347176 isoform X1 [Heterocephalus glaber]
MKTDTRWCFYEPAFLLDGSRQQHTSECLSQLTNTHRRGFPERLRKVTKTMGSRSDVSVFGTERCRPPHCADHGVGAGHRRLGPRGCGPSVTGFCTVELCWARGAGNVWFWSGAVSKMHQVSQQGHSLLLAAVGWPGRGRGHTCTHKQQRLWKDSTGSTSRWGTEGQCGSSQVSVTSGCCEGPRG